MDHTFAHSALRVRPFCTSARVCGVRPSAAGELHRSSRRNGQGNTPARDAVTCSAGSSNAMRVEAERYRK